MRVGYDTTATTLSRAGPGRYAAELREALGRHDGLELVVLSAGRRPPRGAADRLIQGLRREGLYYPWRLGRQVRRRGLHVLHCPAAAAPHNIAAPVVLTIHDALPWRFPELFSRVNVLQVRVLVGRAARHATRIITGSEHARGDIVDLVGVDPERVRVTPYGVHERFRPVPVSDRWLADGYGVHGRYVLAVGTLEPRKNLPRLLQAFALLAADDPDLSLVVVGGRGWRTDAADAALARFAARVVATGHVADETLVRLYSRASCFAYPSLYEGFGWPPLEAMACGSPVVCSDRGSLPEVVGDAAEPCDPEDVEGIAAALHAVLSSAQRAEDLRARGRARAARFTWQACAAGTVDVYREALAAAGR